MTQTDVLQVNFTLSPAARTEIEHLMDKSNADQPGSAAVPGICWGLYHPNSGPQFGAVAIGFYDESQLPDIKHGIQEVSGLKFVYFTTPEYHKNFEGKVLDYTEKRQFFLRDP